MDQFKASLEIAREMERRESDIRRKQIRRNMARRHLPKEVRELLRDIDDMTGPDGDVAGY